MSKQNKQQTDHMPRRELLALFAAHAPPRPVGFSMGWKSVPEGLSDDNYGAFVANREAKISATWALLYAKTLLDLLDAETATETAIGGNVDVKA